MDIHIATQYLSTPKSEDVIYTASAPHRYVMVVADGASSLGCNGREISGGGREAAQIAARTALTYLTGHLLPALSIEEMVARLLECFRKRRQRLKTQRVHHDSWRHNTPYRAPVSGREWPVVLAVWQSWKRRPGLIACAATPFRIADPYAFAHQAVRWQYDDNAARVRDAWLPAIGGRQTP